MRDQDLIDRARRDIDDLSAVLTDLRHIRADFWHWAQVGYPSAGSGRTSGHGDPTATTAFSTDSRFADEMRAEYTGIEDDLEVIHLAAKRLIRRRNLATHHRATVPGEPGCTSCRRVKAHDGQALWTVVYNTSLRLCRWCHDFRDLHGTLPAPELVALHVRDGQKVTRRLIREYHPELKRGA